MTDTIAKLREESGRLRERLAQIDSFLLRYEEWEREAASVLTWDEHKPTKPTPTVPGDTRERVPMSEATPLPDFEAVARRMFAEAENPLPRGDAYARLLEMGVVVPGFEPPNTMTTRFSRMADVTNLKGYGYWLKTRPYPPARYRAELADIYVSPDPESDDDDDIIGAITKGES